MIIQCDHCSAKFRMDDSKLANGPVKVRCAKCKEVFSVSKEEPSPVLSPQLQQDDDATFSGASAGEWSSGNASSSAAAMTESAVNDNVSSTTGFSLDFDEMSSGVSASTSVTAEFSDISAGFDLAATGVDNTEKGGGLELSFGSGDGDFDFGEMPSSEGSLSASSESISAAENDFAMAFGEVSFSEAPPVIPESSGKSDLPEQNEDLSGFSASGSAVENEGFDFSFSEEVAVDSTPPGAAKPEESTANFGEFDFGEMAPAAEMIKEPVIETHSQESAAPTEISGANGIDHPVIKAQLQESSLPPQDYSDSAGMEFNLDDNEEAPPLALSSRTKRGSFFPVTVIIGAILLVILLAGGAVYFVSGPKVFSKVGLGFLVDWYGTKGGEEGSISVRNITAEYIANKEAGELFVVRGEALNNYSKPRASIQVKVTILGSGGTALLTKATFCGNSLSREQLVTLPLVKLDETLNNQFGDSLANMGVKPGNAIPFVIVVNNVPKEAIDFSVQVSGSTIATQ